MLSFGNPAAVDHGDEKTSHFTRKQREKRRDFQRPKWEYWRNLGVGNRCGKVGEAPRACNDSLDFGHLAAVDHGDEKLEVAWFVMNFRFVMYSCKRLYRIDARRQSLTTCSGSAYMYSTRSVRSLCIYCILLALTLRPTLPLANRNMSRQLNYMHCLICFHNSFGWKRSFLFPFSEKCKQCT